MLLSALLSPLLLALGCASAGSPEVPATDPTETTEESSPETSEGSAAGSEASSEEPSEPGSSAGSESSIEDGTGEMSANPGVEPPSGPQTTSERAAGLDSELDKSLQEFDGMILREQEILEEKRSGTEGMASGAGGGSRGSSGAAASDRPTGSEDAGDRSGGNAGTRVSSGSEQEISERDKARTPPDIGDGGDDDIVARQLREAALAEDDPELREKLWEEYRKYKQAG